MQRILSFIRHCGRLGFAVLLLAMLFVLNLCEAQEWGQVELAQSEFGIQRAEMASDSFGNLHIYYLDVVSRHGAHFHTQLKFMYVSGSGNILWGPTTLNPNVVHPSAQYVNVTGDGMTKSWCIWGDTLVEPQGVRGMLLASFDAQAQELTDAVYLGPLSGQANTQWNFDLVYRPQNSTLHLVDARFLAYYSEVTSEGEVLVWWQPVDTIFITSEVHMATSPSGEVWAVFRNEIPGYVEAVFVRFNDDGSMTVLHPFGTGQEHFSAVRDFAFGQNGEAHLVTDYDDIGRQYCRMDSVFSIEEWHDLGVGPSISYVSLGVNQSDHVLVTWAEEWDHVIDLYGSIRAPDSGWTQNGAVIASQLREIGYLYAAPIDNNNWAFLTSVETDNPPRNPSSLYLFTTDTTTSEVTIDLIETPSSLLLSTFPNPFNSTLSISLSIPEHQAVTVSLYDLLGREVDVIHRGRLESSTINYAAPANLASGVYFIRAATESQTVMRKVVLLK